MNIPPFLEKLLTKEAFAKATELILNQPPATDKAVGDDNHTAVRVGLISFIETLDDQVSLIPFAGPILKAIVDSPGVDAEEARLADFVIESVYRALKYSGQVGAAKVTDPINPSQWKSAPEGKPLTDNDFAPNSSTGGNQ